ncbi:MAG TPA: RNA polymerase sigma factor [Burkholderiales bacterium]|nr:RNA polymerase sigma factor [Burkholderiales bacterium]
MATSVEDERAAFNRLTLPHLDELRAAARREIRYRVAIGDLGPDDLAPEELVGDTLARAWQDRHRRPGTLGVRAWLLALLHRVCESIVQRERHFRKLQAVPLERAVPPPPIYDDDEEFWEWYQPDDMTKWEDVAAEPEDLTPEEVVQAEEELRSLAPRPRLAWLLRYVHRLTVPEIAQALGVNLEEAARLIAEARPGKAASLSRRTHAGR